MRIEIRRIIFAPLIVLLLSGFVAAQEQGDACHVYVVDVLKARKIIEGFHETGNATADAKLLAAGETVYPEFRTVIGEEILTTKTYPFPGSKLIITASVYYTDESMASSEGADSMLLGLVVTNKAQKDALSADDNAVAEMTLNERDTVRVKKYLTVGGKQYLVGIECRCKEKKGTSGGANE